MKFGIKAFVCGSGLLLALILFPVFAYADAMRDNVLREAAKRAGFVPANQTHVQVDQKLVAVGKLIFQSKKLSLDRETACASCHLDRFGSSDGLPNAVGTQGFGEGMERLSNGGDIIPRNTMPFWGVGGIGYDVFFWDGKVQKTSGAVISQFGDASPSTDPLIVAVHLPPVEIGEMVSDTQANEALQTESLDTVSSVYERLLEELWKDDQIKTALYAATGKSDGELVFLDVAKAVASFIRDNFKLKSTAFHKFVFNGGQLTDQEIAGGLIFYGKGRCSICHNGPYFSDMQFHAVPFPQVGFGKNGFGVDYGRFNVTLNPDDRYKFRTPPLFNVSKTSPYSHSGSIVELADAIRAHVDPFAVFDPTKLPQIQRAEYYQSFKAWADEPLVGVALDEEDIGNLISFLQTLEYDSANSVVVTD